MSTLREMVSHRGLKSGTLVWEFATPGIGHLLRSAGCEFVFLDMEHSGIGIDSLKQVLRYLEAADISPIVRPPGKGYHQIASALDVGAEGLVLPMVGSAEEAERIVQGVKYAPRGSRGVGLGIGHDRYAPAATPAIALAEQNERTVVFALIETREGVENVEAIAAVDGIDGLWMGHFVLSTSLGVPGQFDHPEYLASVERVVAAGKSQDKALGRVVGSVEEGAAMFSEGYDFIGLFTDTQLYTQALGGAVAGLRDACR